MDVIIYGAGKEGKEAYETLMQFPENNVLFFVDKDEDKQRDKWFCGHEVHSPSVLTNYVNKEVRIVVSARGYFNDVYEYLLNLGFKDIVGLGSSEWNEKRRIKQIYGFLNKNRCIDLGAFLMDHGSSISLPEIPFVNGGSGILDYAFLLKLAQKYRLKSYLEIGTYIGTSINVMSTVCNRCYGITAPIGADYSMREWCRSKDIMDYSSALVKKDNIHMFYSNSRCFDYSVIDDDIDLFFIDGDHSYNGVYCDTKNIFNIRKESSIVVWHDFQQSDYGDDVVLAVKDALGSEFDNVYVTDNNICGIYIPKELQYEFPKGTRRFNDNKEYDMYVYDVKIQPKMVRIN